MHHRSVTVSRSMLPRVRFERFVDSHTEGEPTRVLLSSSGGPFAQTLDEVLARWTIDGVLTIPPEVLALAAHPRAADATVCALLCAPSKATAHCGVLFWNASAVLGMCGHATIGLARTLASMDPKFPSHALFETRVGDVTIERRADGRIAFANIESRLHARDVELALETGGIARGDVAWGGNWFFIMRLERPMRSLHEESVFASAIARAIEREHLRAGPENNGLIDHVALIFPPSRHDADARNFVLCPNGTFDRSPCGTGTSALLASVAARGQLAPMQLWRQESAIGSLFEAQYTLTSRGVIATICGRAFIIGHGTLVDSVSDPARTGCWEEPV